MVPVAITPPSATPRSTSTDARRRRASGQPNYDVLIAIRTHRRPAALEDFPLGDPVARLGEGFRRVGLEHNTFARSPTPRIHEVVIALGKFLPIVVRIKIGTQIDIALRPLQRVVEF